EPQEPAKPLCQWLPGPTNPDQVHYFENGLQQGTYCYSTGLYYPFDGQAWGEPTAPPPGCPQRNQIGQRKQEVQNFGVDQEHLHQHEAHSLTGRHATQKEVFSALPSANLTDDSQKLHLTVIGDARDVLRDLDISQTLSAFKDKLLVQAYPSTHWAVAPFQ